MAEESREDKVPRTTRAQLQLWLADPTTQRYFQSIEFIRINTCDSMGNGDCYRAEDPVMTQQLSTISMAVRETLVMVQNVETVLMYRGLVQPIPSEEETDEDD